MSGGSEGSNTKEQNYDVVVVFLQLEQYRVAKVHVSYKVFAGKPHAFFSSIRDEKKL